MAAIGVDRHIYIWIGGWARGSDVVDRCYIDPTFMPSPAAYQLYGWALSRQYAPGPGEVVAATTLPDPRTEAVDEGFSGMTTRGATRAAAAQGRGVGSAARAAAERIAARHRVRH